MPDFVMMIGPPGCGKSTYISNFIKETGKEYLIAGTDKFIEEYAVKNSMTYHEAFKILQEDFNSLVKKMNDEISVAIISGKNIILDQTNMNVKSRAKKLSAIPSSYHKVAIVFDISKEIHNSRIKERKETTGKSVPYFVVENMLKTYEAPSKTEGFDDIVWLLN